MNEKIPSSRAVVALSGGMDSTGLLLHLLAKDTKVTGISFDYGQKHKLELDRLDENLEYLEDVGLGIDHHLINVGEIGSLFHSALLSPGWKPPEGHYEQENMKETVVPNRNAIFSSISYGLALSIAIREQTDVALAMGVHSGDHEIYPDCRPEFYAAIEIAFSCGNWDSDRVAFYLPYLVGDKSTILIDALESCETLGLNFDTVFANTNTSYAPDEDGIASGKTGSDVERILAFHAIGRKDPVAYEGGWDKALSHALQLEAEAKA